MKSIYIYIYTWNFSLPRILDKASHTNKAEQPDKNATVINIKIGATHPDFFFKKKKIN